MSINSNVTYLVLRLGFVFLYHLGEVAAVWVILKLL